MADKDKKNKPLEPNDEARTENIGGEDNSSQKEFKVEENKVRYLSPGQMVIKRFARSKLSVAGLITLIVLFVFSFVGPFLSPYPEAVADTSQGSDSVLDYKERYAEKVDAYSAKKELLLSLTQGAYTEADFLDETVAGNAKKNEAIIDAAIETLFEELDGEFGSYMFDGEEGFFEIAKVDTSYMIYLREETEDGSLERIFNYIYTRFISNKDININAAPSWSHWLGTDAQAFDIFTRLMYGGRISLTLGFVVIFVQMLIGILLGGMAGFFGKWVDNIVMRVVDLLSCLPSMPILLIFSAILDGIQVPEGLRIYLLMGMLSIIGWGGIARVIRGQILTLREQEYMVAAEALGIGVPRRIVKHLMPNIMPLLIVQMTLGLGGVILTESTLSYLGLGIRVPAAAWGTMISAADNPVILENYPNQWVPAGIMIVLAVLAFNFVGDGLRDAFDPKSRR